MEKFCHINSIVSNSSINSNKGFLNDTVPRNYNRVIDLMIIIIDKGGEMDTMRVRIQILWYENIKLRDKLVASSKIYPPEEVKQKDRLRLLELKLEALNKVNENLNSESSIKD